MFPRCRHPAVSCRRLSAWAVRRMPALGLLGQAGGGGTGSQFVLQRARSLCNKQPGVSLAPYHEPSAVGWQHLLSSPAMVFSFSEEEMTQPPVGQPPPSPGQPAATPRPGSAARWPWWRPPARPAPRDSGEAAMPLRSPALCSGSRSGRWACSSRLSGWLNPRRGLRQGPVDRRHRGFACQRGHVHPLCRHRVQLNSGGPRVRRRERLLCDDGQILG